MSEYQHIVCPNCSAVNRLPRSRPAAQGKCGKCKQALFLGKPVDLGDNDFDRHINRSDIPVIVDFWADWCGPCKMMAPAFAQAANQLEPNYRLAKLDTEQVQGVAARFGIRSIPTLIAFKRGREVGRQSGAMGLPQLIDWITRIH